MGPGGPDEFSMTQRMEQGTRGAFEILESIVGAFGGFAQMLESTFMATHSSFMAMLGVAEQFGNLRNYFGQVLSIFALIRWTKDLVRRGFGLKPEGRPGEINPAEFGAFEEQKKFSRKPLLVFLFVVFGMPYLMHKFVQVVSRRQGVLQGPDGQPLGPDGTLALAGSEAIDPKNLEFARALYNFTAESPMELSFRRGDIIAILDKRDPTTGGSSQWWRGRLRSGETGMFPCNYVEISVKGGAAGNWTGDTALLSPVPELSADEFAKKAMT
jgi:peroxin-13